MSSTSFKMNSVNDVQTVEPAEAHKKMDVAQWLKRVGPQLKGMSRLIVLGCGTGHHIAKLVDVFPPSKILVIEKSMNNVEVALEHYALEMTEMTVLVPEMPADVLNQAVLLDFFRHSYTVVRFAPATITDPDFYDEIEALISGRTQVGFRALLKCRPEIAALFSSTPELSAVKGQSEKRISIKNLIQSMASESADDACLIRALAELVS